MERARILVVDDKENILKLFARILGDAYEVTTAADGGRAISLIGGQEFDVIVTDLRMPGADGFEVLRDLRSVGCDIMTIGQYLQPTREHLPVARFYDPSEFAMLKEEGRALGFTHVESGPLVRSSYHAEQQVTPEV